MKLQKLTIHNIASIEDTEIDFEGRPLSDSDVFLITGKTGAGKTTILDAICLALFAKTPRFENTNMKGESDDVKGSIGADDTRQMMRRNCGRAHATLTFTGNDGVRYESTWSVARAHGKPGGKLQKKNWELKNLDSGTTYTKDNDIRAELSKAVGLDFNQFCRTTMLAQGEFTRFLNSKDNDKAEILEKITGVDVYSKIGRKVYELTANRKNAYEDARRLLEGIVLLSDGEIAAYREKIAEADREQKKLKEERQKTGQLLTWLKEETELQRKIESEARIYAGLREYAGSDEYKERESLVALWRRTADARRWKRELERALLTVGKLKKRLDDSEETFRELRKGENHIKAEIGKEKKELETTAKAIEAEKEKSGIYANAQAVEVLLKTAGDGKRKIEEEKVLLTAGEKDLDGKLLKNEKEAEVKYIKEQTLKQQKEKEKTELAERLEKADLPGLQKTRENYRTREMSAQIALQSLKELKKERERRETRKAEIADMAAALAKLEEALGKTAPKVREAEIEEQTCRRLFEQQKESVDEWATRVRQSLKTGDTCPVCRQKIERELPDEGEINVIVAGIRKAWEEARKRYDNLKEEERTLTSDMKAQVKSLANARKQYDSDTTLAEKEKSAAKACTETGVDISDGDAEIRLGKIIEDTAVSLKETEKGITAAMEIADKLELARREIDKANKSERQALQKLENARRQITECKGKIEASRRLIEAKLKETSEAEAEVGKIIGDTAWQSDWKSQPEVFMKELKGAARRYSANVEKESRLRQSVREREILQGNVEEAMEAILGEQPQWALTEETGIGAVADILKKANDLRAGLQTAKSQIEKERGEAEELKGRLEAFMTANEGITAEALVRLDTHTEEEIEKTAAELADTQKNMAAHQKLSETRKKEMDQLLGRRPEMEEGATAESLEEKAGQMDNAIEEFEKTKAAYEAALKHDENEKVKKGRLIADAEGKKKELERWESLNNLIGDATGTKFRRIAQSYVLSNLIHSANGYMKTLTDRYRLRVEPGTFLIMLDDAYQGYTSRAASTISGGESFLVSLALALALSDIGDSLSVDTIFIDEGFGTLSGEPLENAINTLRMLHRQGGRHVGIISHVEELRERIPVQIRVNQEGKDSSSRIEIVG